METGQDVAASLFCRHVPRVTQGLGKLHSVPAYKLQRVGPRGVTPFSRSRCELAGTLGFSAAGPSSAVCVSCVVVCVCVCVCEMLELLMRFHSL